MARLELQYKKELRKKIQNDLNLSNPNNETHALVLTSKYTGNSSQEIEVNILLNTIQGDLNTDNILNVLDVVILINCVLDINCPQMADLNSDDNYNVLDIVLLVNLILEN